MKKQPELQGTEDREASADFKADQWIDKELAECEFQDVRHGRRLRKLLGQFSEKVSASTPWACQDWADTKAAYRLFSNCRVTEEQILSGHFQAVRERMPTDGQPILILHDTTEFSHQRKDSTPIGILDISGGHKDGRKRLHTVYGISMHSSLAVTLEGVPLGLTAIKCWTRDNFKAANAPKKINPTRVPIGKKRASAGWRT